METLKTVLNSGASRKWSAFEFQSNTASALLFGIVSVVILLLCGGCHNNGGSDGVTSVTTTTGMFIDDTVQGLGYNCSSGSSGVTNSQGEYTCNAGDDVTFFLGGVSLGTVAAQGSIISPYSLFQGNEGAAINLARLLQSLDSDDDPGNGVIVLDEALIALLPADTDFSSASFTDDIEAALPDPFALISAAEAQARLDEQIVLHGGVPPNRGEAPVADAGPDQGVMVGTPASLDASNSADIDGDELTYRWRLVSYPAASTSSFSDNSIVNPTFTADTAGDYTLQLEVNDGTYSDLDTVTITFSATNSRPVAHAGTDRGVTPNTMVNLDGSGSQDADGDALNYAWSFVAWPTVNVPPLSFSSTATPRFVATVEGLYTLQLVVDDGTEASLADTVNITCRPAVLGTPPALAWFVEKGSSTVYERGTDIGIDSSGNSYVTGWELNPTTNYDFFVTKHNTSGVEQWTVHNVTAGGQQASGIAVDNARGVLYVTGDTFGDLDGQTAFGGRDIFISKYTLGGVHQWTVLSGTALADLPHDVAVDSTGNIYVTGMTEGALNGNTSHGGQDIFISKYDPDGVHQWTVQPGSTNWERGYGIAVDADSYVYVTGYTATAFDGNTSNGSQDAFITKYSTDGIRQWTRQLGTDNVDNGFAVTVDAGAVYMTGRTAGDLLDGTNQGGHDVFIAKYDTDGTRQWVKQFGTPLSDEGRSIALDSASNIYVSGYTTGAMTGENLGLQDYFITKHDNDGQLLWALQNGGTGADWNYGLVIDSADNIYATGSISNPTQTDIFIAKYGNNAISDGLYTVGGTVSGIVGTFTLTNNGGDEMTIEANGLFTFPTGLPDGASYRVEIGTTDPSQGCAISGGGNGDGTGTIPGADVTNILVECYGL